jgi:hypothetical protein
MKAVRGHEAKILSDQKVTLEFPCGAGSNVQESTKVRRSLTAAPFGDVRRDRDGTATYLRSETESFSRRERASDLITKQGAIHFGTVDAWIALLPARQ